jgi:hypothetical protein
MVGVLAGAAVAPAPARADPIAYTIEFMASHLCLDVPHSNPDPGVQAVQWECNGGENQKWWFVPIDGGEWAYIQSVATGMCLNVSGIGWENGTPIIQSACNEEPNEQWRGTRWYTNPNTGKSYYYLEPKHLKDWSLPKRCLNSQGGGVDNGAPMILFQCRPSTSADPYWNSSFTWYV